ncbi:hypothetical protein PAXRUDRAFT_179006, partial [Paxillus rubicundulus Ve08.2h10]
LSCPDPNCQQKFHGTEYLLAHLNDPRTSCWATRPEGYPLPPALRPGMSLPPGDCLGQYHPHSGWTYGQGKNTLQ